MNISSLITWFSSLSTRTQEVFIGAVVVVSSIWIMALSKRAVLFFTARLASRRNSQWSPLMRKLEGRLNWTLFLPLSIIFGLHYFPLPEQISSLLQLILHVILILHAFSFFQLFMTYSIRTFSGLKDDTQSNMTELLTQLFSIGIWISAGFVVIQTLGINLTGLLGGLGIATVIAGFALQNVLADFFAFFSIHFDRPFEVGDFVIVDTDMGTVMKVGIQSTRLRTLEGQELTLPNRKLVESRINNYRRMQNRRIVFRINVVLNTPTSKLRKIPDWIKAIIEDMEQTSVERVHFKEIDDTAYRFEVVYHVEDSDYTLFMDIQQELNLQILEKLQKEKVQLAQPLLNVELRKV